jgi:hypothetical protein
LHCLADRSSGPLGPHLLGPSITKYLGPSILWYLFHRASGDCLIPRLCPTTTLDYAVVARLSPPFFLCLVYKHYESGANRAVTPRVHVLARCRALRMSIFVRRLVQSTAKLNFTVRVQIGARACASVTLHKNLCRHLGSRRLTLPAATLHLYQGFSGDRWSWKRSQVGAHAVEFIDQWVTSELVSISTLCNCFRAFKTQQAGSGIYEQRR